MVGTEVIYKAGPDDTYHGEFLALIGLIFEIFECK